MDPVIKSYQSTDTSRVIGRLNQSGTFTRACHAQRDTALIKRFADII